jgi:hypothetical protein
MGDFVAVVLVAVGVPPLGTDGRVPALVTYRADEPAIKLPAAADEDRRRLTDAVKKASQVGETGRPSAADFDAAIVGWGRQAAHLYLLPLDFEDAVRRHDAAHPDAKLGGALPDFHAVDKNLVLCVGGVHDTIQETLSESLTDLVGQTVERANIGRALVDHLKRLPAKDRAEFVAKLVTAQTCLRSAAREASLGLVSDEADCAKVIRRVGELGANLDAAADRVTKANKEFKAAFEKCVKAAADPPPKK